MQDIFELLSSTNVYLNSRSRKDVNLDVLLAVSSWTSSMLRMLGLGEGSEADAFGRPIIGWGLANVDGAEGAGDVSRSSTDATVEMFFSFRRSQAHESDSLETHRTARERPYALPESSLGLP